MWIDPPAQKFSSCATDADVYKTKLTKLIKTAMWGRKGEGVGSKKFYLFIFITTKDNEFICTKFSLERDGLVKFSTESNGRQPRGHEEKEKNYHISK